MRSRTLLALMLMIALAIVLHAEAAEEWDLGISSVSFSPPSREVPQGGSFSLTVYVRNSMSRPYRGLVQFSIFIDGRLVEVTRRTVGEPPAVPIPAGGSLPMTIDVEATNLSVGSHELTVRVIPDPRLYVDPRMNDNSAQLSFTVIPAAEPILEVEEELLQGVSSEVKVSIPNTSTKPANYRVRLFANGTEVASKELVAPANSVSVAELKYVPSSSGRVLLEVWIEKEGSLHMKISRTVSITPTCDLGIERIELMSRIFIGEEAEGKVVVRNRGPSAANLTVRLELDGELLDTLGPTPIGPLEDKELSFVLPTMGLEIGRRTLVAIVNATGAVDLDASNDERSVTFDLLPVPASASLTSEDGSIRVAVRNLGSIVSTFNVVLVLNGTTVASDSVTLEPGELAELVFEDLKPGVYEIKVINQGYEVASSTATVKGGTAEAGADSLPFILALAVIAAIAAYLLLIRRRKTWTG